MDSELSHRLITFRGLERGLLRVGRPADFEDVGVGVAIIVEMV